MRHRGLSQFHSLIPAGPGSNRKRYKPISLGCHVAFTFSSETDSSHFILPGSRQIEGFLLFPKILAFGKPRRLSLAPLQVTFGILIHGVPPNDNFPNSLKGSINTAIEQQTLPAQPGISGPCFISFTTKVIERWNNLNRLPGRHGFVYTRINESCTYRG